MSLPSLSLSLIFLLLESNYHETVYFYPCRDYSYTHMFIHSIDMVALYTVALLSLYSSSSPCCCFFLTEQSTLEIIAQQTNQIGSFQYKKWSQIEIIMGVITVQAYRNRVRWPWRIWPQTPLCTTEKWNFLWTVAGPRTLTSCIQNNTCHLPPYDLKFCPCNCTIISTPSNLNLACTLTFCQLQLQLMINNSCN